MNLLTHYTPPSYGTWKSDSDASSEARMNAGLALLWRDADGSGVTALVEVNDKTKAQSWLDAEDQTSGPVTGRFMKTP